MLRKAHNLVVGHRFEIIIDHRLESVVVVNSLSQIMLTIYRLTTVTVIYSNLKTKCVNAHTRKETLKNCAQVPDSNVCVPCFKST